MVTGSASAEIRSLKIYHLHTHEKAEIVFKRNGRYDQDGLRKLNYILRDWRRDEPTHMDPRLFDLIWEAYKESGSHEYINVVCGYRSPETNSMLRSRSHGVAKKSQHMLGKAMDFFLPDVPLKKLREIGLKMQGGGVGYYPTSGSPFVHFDVGNVRHWPRMSRRELIALFPNGKTLHIPSDGKPLPGFDQALAAYQARKKSGEVAVASIGSSSSSSHSSGGFLAAFFGGGADEDEDDATVASADDDDSAVQPKAAAAQPVATKAVAAAASNKIRILSPDQADRVELPGVDKPAKQTIVAALPADDVPLPDSAPRPLVDVGATASAGLYGSSDQSGGLTEVALNIPVPTPRPDNTPPPDLIANEQDKAMLLAAAGDDDVMADGEANAPLPADRPDDVDDDEIAPIIAATAAPADAGQDKDSYTVASLPQTVSVPSDAGFPASPEEIIAGAKTPAEEIMAYAASPKSALIARQAGTDATAAVIPVVKTTPKEGRVTAKVTKKTAKAPVVIAAQPDDARWALDSSYVMQNTTSTTAPSFAYNLVRHAPSEVYTTGFQQGTEVADANRFTGKAVTFLTVAKFSTN
jgi:uncharacterized protein YcbK (DUF882 family)